MRGWIIAIAATAMTTSLAYAAAPPAAALTSAQTEALRTQIQIAVAKTSPAEREPFSLPGPNLAGAIRVFAAEQRGPERPGGLQRLCRAFVVELTSPSRQALQGQACVEMNSKKGMDPYFWTVSALTPAAAAAGEGLAKPRDGADDRRAEIAPREEPAPRTRGLQPAAPGGPSAGASATTVEMAPAAPRPPPPPAAAGGRGASAAVSGEANSGGGVERVLTPVLVELGPGEPRTPRHGGSAVVLLSENSADRSLNLALCRALFRSFDSATTSEVDQGERRNKEGDVELLRPLYWLERTVKAPPGVVDRCASRVDRFDFTRAWKIRSKFVLNGRGPYLLIAQADEKRAGLVDLTGARVADAPDVVRYFRDNFSQEDKIWAKERPPGEARAELVAFLGHAVNLAEMPKLIIISTARLGCPLGNFLDVCPNPMAR